jgi:hypothetical protein
MTIVDLTGMVIAELLANTGITAIVGQKVRPEFASNEGPPAVIIRQLGISYTPMGQTRRTRIQAPIFAALCYGNPTGAQHGRVQAAQLANAVVEAVELRGPRRDVSGRLVYLSLVESGGDVEVDPSTKWPFATVTFTYVGSQRAVA